MEYLTVGEVIKAQGIKGEIKVRPLTDNPLRFKKLKIVYIDNRPNKILTARITDGFVFLCLDGCDTRDKALALVGKELKIDRVNAVELDEGSYFIADLIGCTVCDENGNVLGIIKDILQYGAADVITAQKDGKEFRFPFLKRIVEEIDTDARIFKVSAKKLAEVCVYDD